MRWFAALCLLAACNSDRPAEPPDNAVTVFAASSLKELLTGIAGEFEKTTGREVRLQFEASSTLARQLRAGAPADVFVTAAPEWLDQLETRSRHDWLSNRLVCVVQKDVTGFDLAGAPSLAMAGEQVPAGKYARAALSHLGIEPPERTLYGSSVRDVLSKVSQGGAVAGIVYATDAAIDPGVRIAYTFPADSHPRILYSVGVLTENGRAFADALREPAAVERAVEQGFVGLK